MKQITPEEVKNMINAGEDFLLIDIRESYEVEARSIGGVHIPMGEIIGRSAEIPREKPVVIHCAAGGRSAAVINALELEGFNNLYNLQGGINAWT